MVRTILMRLQRAVERLRVVESDRDSGAAADIPSPACRPTCRDAAAATCRETSASRRRSSARRSWSCRACHRRRADRRGRVPGPRPSRFADLLLADHHLDVAGPGIDRFAGVVLALEFALDALARPIADLQEIELAGTAAQDNPPGRPNPRRVGLIQRQLAERQSADGRQSVPPTDPAPIFRCAAASPPGWLSSLVFPTRCTAFVSKIPMLATAR